MLLNTYFLEKYGQMRHREMVKAARMEQLIKEAQEQKPKLWQQLTWRLGDWIRSQLMHSLKLNEPENRLNIANLMLRLMLCHNEVFRLPAAGRSIKVVTGTAWVTVNGRDIFLASRRRLWLPSRRDSVLISALGRNSLILEVFGTTSQNDGGGNKLCL